MRKTGARLRVPYLILLAEALFFYRHVLFFDGFVIPWDLRYFHLPHASFIAECFRNGELPLWDPYIYCGRPFSANVQVEWSYPPLALAVLISNWTGGANLLYFLEWEVVLHVFLAGVFTFWLLRRLGTNQPAALLGASVCQLGGFFASQTQHMGAVNAAAWMPLAWLSVLALRDGPRRRWLPALALSLAMSVLSGLPAVTVAVFGSSLLLAAALALVKSAPGLLPVTVALGGLWALALSAIQLLPTVQLSQLSVGQYRTDWLGTGGGIPLAALVSLVFPNFYGIFDFKRYSGPWQPTFLYLYSGLLGLLLAAIAAFARRTRETMAFALLTLIAAFWMLGDSTPVGRILYLLLPTPVRNALHPEFAMPAFTLALAVLAGLGAQQFLRRRSMAYTAVFLTALDLTLAGSGRPMNTGSLRDEPGVTQSSFEGSPEALSRMRLLVSQTFPPWRIDVLNASQNWSMTASLIQVPTANGYDPLALVRTMQARLAFCKGERWGTYYEIADLASPVLDLMNVRYVLSRNPLPASTKFVHIADLPGHLVYENTQALPRFFLVNRIRRAAGLAEAAAALRAPDFDPRAEAIVEPPVDFQSAASPPSGKIRVLEYRPSRVLLEVDSPAPAFLVTSETHYPGWRAFLDGQPSPISYTNVAFRGLPVPAGQHRVHFQFAPAILWYSAALTAASLIFLLCVLCVPFASLREPPPVAPPPPPLLP